jgi:integrase
MHDGDLTKGLFGKVAFAEHASSPESDPRRICLVNTRVARKTALVRQVPTPVVPVRQQKPAISNERVSHRGLFLTREEMAAIAAATVTHRDQLLVRALAETGARLGELLKLTPDRGGEQSRLNALLCRRQP